MDDVVLNHDDSDDSDVASKCLSDTDGPTTSAAGASAAADGAAADGTSPAVAWETSQGGFRFAALEASAEEHAACAEGHFCAVEALLGANASHEAADSE